MRFERGKESVVSPSFKVGDLDGVQVLNLSGWGSGRGGGEQIEQTFRQLIPRPPGYAPSLDSLRRQRGTDRLDSRAPLLKSAFILRQSHGVCTVKRVHVH